MKEKRFNHKGHQGKIKDTKKRMIMKRDLITKDTKDKKRAQWNGK
jgi:hypothetical protein